MTEPARWADGQRLAQKQLEALAAAAPDAIEIVGTAYDDTTSTLQFDVSLDLTGLPHAAGGIVVRARERFEIVVDARFPFSVPTVKSRHRRWAGSDHVQWGRQLCLYAAPSTQWTPADGMRGFIDRLRLWLEKASLGELDPDGQPLHPPANYAFGDAGKIVVRADLATLVPWAEGNPGDPVRMLALCEQDGDRLDIVKWMREDVYNALAGLGKAPADEHGTPYVTAPALLIDTHLGFEYPNTAQELAAALDAAGVGNASLLELLGSAARANLMSGEARGVAPFSDGDQPHGPGGSPLLFILGTPSRRMAEGPRLAHLVAWRVDRLAATRSALQGLLVGADDAQATELRAAVQTDAQNWLRTSMIPWASVYEDRPEVTARRDGTSPAAWLQGKRVLVFGCGALGAPAADICVRAGASHVTVVDKGLVTPGILVRQPYLDAEIGQYKALALAERLKRLRRGASASGDPYDVVEAYLRRGGPPKYDLVIDATADASVRAALEHARNAAPNEWPPVVTVLIGHEARRGVMALSRSGASGAGHDCLRRLGVAVRTTHADSLADIATDLYPATPRTALFFPEPGCSAPTFVGSAAEATTLAAGLMSAALDALAGTGPVQSKQPMAVAVVGLDAPSEHGARRNTGTWIGWPNDTVVVDADGGTLIKISLSALATIKAEARRAERLHGPDVETGGMLLGQIDDATRTAYVDITTRPTPDSRLSNAYFEHGTEGAQELLEHHRKRSNGSSGFIGLWHTHPHGPALPSPTDQASMANFVAPITGGPPRSLILIVGGDDGTWPKWLADVGSDVLPRMYAAVVRRNDPSSPPPPLKPAPPGTYYPGGWAPQRTVAVRRRRHWWQRHRRPTR